MKAVVTTNVSVLPPCNRNAESVEGVYDIRKLMSADLLDHLDSVARQVINTDVEELSKDTRYFKIEIISISLIVQHTNVIILFVFKVYEILRRCINAN